MQPAPVSPKKGNPWMVAAIVLALVLLFCLLLAAGAFSFAVWKGYIAIPGINTPNTPRFTLPNTPKGGGGPNQTPQGTSGPLTVEPYKPQPTDRYPTLQNLAPNWKDPTAPGTSTYDVTVPAALPVLLATGWCTSTQPVLDQNFQHIQYTFSVDGQPLSLDKLNQESQPANGQVCRDLVGLIRSWPSGKHTIKITMSLDAKINDGWNDFAAGDYVEVYNITTLP